MSTSTQINNKIGEICRVCAKRSTKTINLFGIRKKGLMLADMLSICAQTKVRASDSRPSNICNGCLSNLEVAFDFYNLVKSSEDKFQKEMTNSNEKQSQSQPVEFCVLDDDTEIHKEFKLEINEENAREKTYQQQIAYNQNQKTKINDVIENWKMVADNEQKLQQEMYNRKMNRLFECFLCKEKLKSYRDTRVHLKQHNAATPFRCKICSMHFSAQQFELHLCKGQSVKCDYCLNNFQTTQSLLNHLESHTENYMHKCADCSKIFPMIYLLECHREQHRQDEKRYMCHICNRGFKLNFLLTKHLTTHSDARRNINRNNHEFIFFESYSFMFISYDFIFKYYIGFFFTFLFE